MESINGKSEAIAFPLDLAIDATNKTPSTSNRD